MKNNKLLLLFAVVALAQTFTALHMAWQWEDTLRTGQRFVWETAPVDPYDAFKGKYIDLRFKETGGVIIDGAQFTYGQTAYAIIGENAEGKAYISGIASKPPASAAYVKVKVLYTEGGKTHVELPFKRYYLPENMAAPAEIAYRENAGKTGIAAVRLKNGYGVVEKVYIGDQTLEEHLLQSH
ncbi:MAG: GDYXXLXY domain-containing protein [Negativicutes bacterium]|nr:GDYXXLXY domain-containing protein [Negativicutes bacterium]